ncbi:MAG: 8-amino-7-oxononanoate synthase [Chlamydiales bacterium]|nr:8-amino-7-oxononanoate synthase [Chlamydiales bacterium]
MGFARCPELIQTYLEKLHTLSQLGSTGSRLFTGNSAFCEHLEVEIADYHGEEAGLIFNSGYTANLGLLSSVCSREDTILYDERVHASIRDGITLSRARHHRFSHNCVEHLEKLLKKCRKPPFVVIESIYSTDGKLAPLKEMISLCNKHHARLIVDEAVATGVYGEGLVRQPVFARTHTFSKALGVHGAIVLGSAKLRAYLITTARSFIYTTALSTPQLIAIECAYQKLKNSKHTLLELCAYAGYKSPIFTLPLPKTKQDAFDVRTLLYPTVARNEECLRVCLHTFNTKEEIDQLYAWINYDRN